MFKGLVNLVLSGAVGIGLIGISGCITETRITRIPHVLRKVISWSEADSGISQPKTLEEIVRYQQACIKPSLETNYDDWKSAERTHREGYGDCEDYAVSAAYFLEKIGYDPLIMIFPANGKVGGHALAVFKKTGEEGVDKYGYIDYGIYGSPIYKSFEELAEDLSKMHKRNSGSEYAWKNHVVLNLNDFSCDWKHGKENLLEYFKNYVRTK